MRKATHTA